MPAKKAVMEKEAPVQPKIRIRISAYDHKVIDASCKQIIDTVVRQGCELLGPIPLPTKKLRVTTRKSPDGEGTATWDRFEMRVHKRVIDLGLDERALRLVMRVPIPEGLNIEIEMIE